MEVFTDTNMDTMSGVEIIGKKVTVLGAARSGIAVAELLMSKGAKVFVSDNGSREKLMSGISRLASLGIAYEIGQHTDRALDADIIVVSPGIFSTIPFLKDAQHRRLRIVSELEIASWFCLAPIIAVTGTNGKTTTTALIGRLMHDARKHSIIGGNIGTAFSSLVDELDTESVAVLEVSSFQLEQIEQFHPTVSAILNITPDHLDRYEGSIEKYTAAKCRIFENQEKDDVLIYSNDDAGAQHAIAQHPTTARRLAFGIERTFDNGAYIENGMMVTMIDNRRSEIIETDHISIRGIHNLYNSMAATLAALSMDVNVPSIRATLKNFKGVEHRLEFVREWNGITYVNDSKATNVDSVWYALQSFTQPIVLLLGGRDKGNDYARLSDLVRSNVRAIVAIGESSEKILSAFSHIKSVCVAQSMEEAVRTATQLAMTGDVVLLSPACASFDWFENYEHRGKVFKEIVGKL